MSARLVMGKFGLGAASKYKAQPTFIDGIRFPSKKQAERYRQLKALEAAGEIRELRLEVPYPITVNRAKVCTYRADFVYEQRVKDEWVAVVEDCKGYPTPVYKLKKKLIQAVYGIEIRET